MSNRSLHSGTEAQTGAAHASVTFRPATDSEISPALGMILGEANRPATPSQVAEFVLFATLRHIDLHQMWVADRQGKLVWCTLPMPSPGRTLLLFTPPITAPILETAAQLLEVVCHLPTFADVHLAQVLLDPGQIATRQFFEARRFMPIAELIYLQGHPPRGAKPAAIPAECRMEEYSLANHGLFAEAILGSYEQSLDCPALSGLRDIEDIIAGHKATGEYDPALWKLLLWRDKPAGVLLLATMPGGDSMELVYLGLPPVSRGRGFAAVLMQEAMYQLGQRGCRRLTLAVDARNDPALRLYYGFGLHRVGSRFAMIRDLRST